MIRCISSIVYFLSIVVVRKAHSDWLIQAQKMTKEVPTPRILNGLKRTFFPLDVDGS